MCELTDDSLRLNGLLDYISRQRAIAIAKPSSEAWVTDPCLQTRLAGERKSMKPELVLESPTIPIKLVVAVDCADCW